MDVQQSSLKTGLYSWHVAHKGNIVDFAGWKLPVWFSSIKEEHMSVRSASGLFDTSHMGRFLLKGNDAVAFLEPLVTNHVATCDVGKVRYAFACDANGGVLDDLTFFRRAEDEFMIVVNASNRLKLWNYFKEKSRSFPGLTLTDATLYSSMLALQGPKSMEIMGRLTSADLAPFKKWSCGTIEFAHHLGLAFVSGSGYTGEDGFEVVFFDDPKAARAGRFADLLLAEGVRPCGLGARDTLRLEAGNPLYGHEISETITPLEAGLGFAVKLEKEFIGRAALDEQSKSGLKRKIAGLVLETGIPRDGFTVSKDGKRVGTVTSGTFSPILEKGIALALLDAGLCSEGEKLEVDVRGKPHEAAVVKTPFYDTRLWGRKREVKS